MISLKKTKHDDRIVLFYCIRSVICLAIRFMGQVVWQNEYKEKEDKADATI